MMLAGGLRVVCAGTVSGLALVVRFGEEKEEMEARWMSDWSSPNAEVQSLAGVLRVVLSPWEVCWVGCVTSGGGDEDGEEETLRGCVLGSLRVETLSLAGVLGSLLLLMLCLGIVCVLEEGDGANLLYCERGSKSEE